MSKLPSEFTDEDLHGWGTLDDSAKRMANEFLALRAELEKARGDVVALRSEINRITHDFNALGAERDSARALLRECVKFCDILSGHPAYANNSLRARIAKEIGE
jgi:hypothetical protein